YTVLVGCFEVLAALVLISCVIFLIRRNVLRIKRLVQKELNGWPKTDANLILVTEIVLMALFLTMNAADYNLQQIGSEHYTATGAFWISGWIAPLFAGLDEAMLIGIERAAWWLHIIGVFAFLNYLP